jgi:uncharacterized protein
LISCSVQKNNNKNVKNKATILVENDITEFESNITNEFIDAEFKKELYKSFKNIDIVVITEALKKTKPISVYEFNLKYKESWGKFINQWILDTVQIKKIKIELEKEEVYHWQVSDFKNIKVSLLKHEELRKKINTNTLFNDSGSLVIYLSKPLMIDKNNALISYEIMNCKYICISITHFTVLMKKVNNKWKQKEFYEDGVYY